MNSESCSIVGFRKTGAVSRMKSFQNCPGSSSTSGGGPSRMSRSSNPCASRLPAKDSSITKTTRWPRSRRTCPIPTQLFVGPYAPSGKKTTVATEDESFTVGCQASKRGVVSLQFSSMTSQTAETEPVDVGERLRAIRRLRRVTLKTVAERADLSESFLSQVERGRANASVASLKRIAAALGVNVADLFEPNGSTARPRVLRRETRPNLAFGTLGRKFMLTPRPLENLQVIVGELDAGGSTGDDPYTHGDSEELLVVLEGVVSLQLGSDVFELSTGDSIDYRSSTPHRLVNVGGDPAEVMWIISPPSY